VNYKYHFIKNFPKNYPWYRKFYANLLFFFGGIIIHPRNNWLTKADLRGAYKVLKKGDVVLVGGLRELSKIFIDDIFTHVMIYVGGRRFVNSVGDGVEIDSLHAVFCQYDDMVVLRHKDFARKNGDKKRKAFVKAGLAQVGRPYDFEFAGKKESFYCVQFVNYAASCAGIKILQFDNPKTHILYPRNVLNKYFDVVFVSHNLKFDGMGEKNAKGRILLYDEEKQLEAQEFLC
jgi:hypothetical protein